MKVECPELTRCCFCLPLRKSILVFGYVKLIFCILAVIQYVLLAQTSEEGTVLLVYQGSMSYIVTTDICIVIYIIEGIATGLLIYGLHKTILQYIKWFFYYSILSTVVSVILQTVQTFMADFFHVKAMLICSIFIHGYLLLLIRSFLKKMEKPVEPDNQVHQVIINGEEKKNEAK